MDIKKLIKLKAFWFAIIVTLVGSVSGSLLAKLPYVKVIGAMVIALLIGMIVNIIKPLKDAIFLGVGFISNKFLRLGIILLGFKLNLIVLANSGIKSIVLAIVVVSFTIVVTYLLAKKFGVNDELALLGASGCGICGAAAVMGVSPQVKSKSDDTVLAVAVVCILGTVFTLIEVLTKPILGLNDTQFGILNGASLHEIAHAVAAAGSGGEKTIEIALIMKLSRVLLLAPVALLIGIYFQKKNNLGQSKAKLPIPWFMLGFIIASGIGTMVTKQYGSGVKPIVDNIVSVAYIFLGMAMCALGISVNFEVIKKRGSKIFIAASIGSILLFVLAYISAKIFF